jgi:uncharacterized membrane protein YjgN (DUF898 family)
MTVVDATAPLPVAAESPAPPQIVRFRGNTDAYWRLLIRGNLLLMVTLGIYRFWLVTDIRRFLWANTEIAGESLEYTGTARELLIGFLIALTILIPIYVLFAIAALELGVIGQISGVVAFILLAFLGQIAVYRARRYRLTRTIYRGIRFHQSGAGWRYAVRAMVWWILMGLTIGLAYPFAQASLERYKMRHTWYGNLRGRFEGSGMNLFLRGLTMWILVVGPFAAAVVMIIATLDVTSVIETARAGGSDVVKRIESANPGFETAMGFMVFALIWGVLAAIVLYPAFHALTIRWWASGVRFGEVTVTSELRTKRIYGAYLRFLLYSFVFGLIAAIMIGMAAGAFVPIFTAISKGAGKSEFVEYVSVGLLLVSYVVFMLGYSVIHQVVVKLAVWRLTMESLDLTGFAALDWVKAAGTPSSAVGEGLADALDVGGF